MNERTRGRRNEYINIRKEEIILDGVIIKDSSKETYAGLSGHQKEYMKFKRAVDTAFAAVALLVLSPLLIVVSIIIKIDSPKEPILFRQLRVGLDGKPFTIYKFRSMRSAAPSELSTSEFLDAEAYITRLGRILRNTSIDELPQLLNVLRGEMAIIGPRPLILSEKDIHAMRMRYGVYQVRPGLSGLAQVHGRDALNGDCKALWDSRYVEGYGLTMDCAIFFQSVVAVLKRTGVIDNKREKEKLLEMENG